MTARGLGVIVLAAGRGTRMRSALPKVLHPVCGLPMATHILDAARSLGPARIAVVVGYGAAAVREALAADDLVFIDQEQLLGTGDAVARCREALAGCDPVVVVNGDVPLITPALLSRLVEKGAGCPVALVTCTAADAGRLGRVVRDAGGRVAGVVEAAEYDGPSGAGEVNSGQYRFAAAWLWEHVGGIPRSGKGEHYLTHLVAAAAAEGSPVTTIDADPAEALGVDDRVHLAEAERVMRQRILVGHMEAGVTVVDPATTYINRRVRLAEDVTILPNCYLHGETMVGTRTTIGPSTTLRNARIAEDCHVQASVVEDSAIGARTTVGPYAHLRENAVIGEDCVLGNYAEVKNSNLGQRVKMHHFSYLGDADVGDDANIAAGMITCNFDGVHKHRTVIGARAFIGCDTMLIAPVTVGADAVTGAGSVVREDVPAGAKVAGVPARIIGQARAEE